MPRSAQSVLKCMRRVTVLQGEARVSADPDVELGTILGSCVATCLYDAQVRVGGMNHFLLPEPRGGHDPGRVDVHYGTYLMEILINEMLAFGAKKNRLRAHLYGGGNLRPAMAPIGTANAQFARTFLEREGITLARCDLGGNQARRIDFRPASGQVRCRIVPNQMPSETAPVVPEPAATLGAVELF